MKCVIAVAALLLTLPVFGMEEAELLAKIAKRQQQLDHYAVDMQIRVFGSSDSTADLTFPALAVRSGPVMLQEFQSFIVLMHPEMRIVVDRAERTIYLNASRTEMPAQAAMDPVAALSKAREAGYEMMADEGAGGITLRFTAASRPTYFLTFDAEDLQLQRMEMVAPQDAGGAAGRTVVSYTWHEAGESNAERMKTSYYVEPSSGGWQPAPAFDGYRIVVSREN